MTQFIQPGSVATPLCVDLDGTLVKSDTLHDGLLKLARSQPWRLVLLLASLGRGKAFFKREVARIAGLDITRLPYNHAVLRFIEEQRAQGRRVYLTTGADSTLAGQVADHLGCFDAVLASDGTTNMTGNRKLASLQKRFGVFDYIGNARADLPVLAHSTRILVANPTLGLRWGLKATHLEIAERFEDRVALPWTLLKAFRVHQWAKNILLFLPLLLSHALTGDNIVAALVAFVCFSLVASANYIVNDLLDVEHDRHHAKKRLRPFAAGDISVPVGLGLAILLVAVSVSLLPLLPLNFAFWLLVYVVSTTVYSLGLKRVALIDVLMLSGLYTLRMLAGGAATETPISPWLASFAIFLFLSLAMVKRFSELENLREQGGSQSPGRGYQIADMEQIRSFGTASAYAAVVVFSLYITRPDVDALYHHANRLWLILPFMLYWLHRVWLMASRGELNEDPVIFAMRDRVSLALGASILLLAVLAAI
uniref:Putative prenyltransferase n=1 Tax=mine drainage metagenome TaxID=410659 RepID=E6PX18_9ZZZZ